MIEIDGLNVTEIYLLGLWKQAPFDVEMEAAAGRVTRELVAAIAVCDFLRRATREIELSSCSVRVS